MSRAEELAKQPDALGMFHEIASCAGNTDEQANVFNALWSFWNFEHALDDVLDEGNLKPDEKVELLRLTFDFIGCVLSASPENFPAVKFKKAFSDAVAAMDWPHERRDLAMQSLLDFTGNMAANPFYQRHRQEHCALFEMIIFRAIAGDAMESSTDDKVRALAPAVRCGDVDWLVHCARLVGGWELGLKVSGLRDYDVDK